MFLMGASLFGAMLLLPLYWQELRGADALGAGLLLASQGVGSLLSRTVAPRVMGWIGARSTVIVGFAIAALATLPFAFSNADTSIVWLEIVLLVRGFGLSLVMIPLMSVAFVGLDRAEVPHASIVTRVAQQIGGSVGVAVLAVILTSTATSSDSLVTGFQVAFWVAVGLTLGAIVVALVLPGRRAGRLGSDYRRRAHSTLGLSRPSRRRRRPSSATACADRGCPRAGTPAAPSTRATRRRGPPPRS